MDETAQATALARKRATVFPPSFTNHSRPAASTDVAQRPLPRRLAGWTVADILGLDWQGEMP